MSRTMSRPMNATRTEVSRTSVWVEDRNPTQIATTRTNFRPRLRVGLTGSTQILGTGATPTLTSPDVENVQAHDTNHTPFTAVAAGGSITGASPTLTPADTENIQAHDNTNAVAASDSTSPLRITNEEDADMTATTRTLSSQRDRQCSCWRLFMRMVARLFLVIRSWWIAPSYAVYTSPAESSSALYFMGLRVLVDNSNRMSRAEQRGSINSHPNSRIGVLNDLIADSWFPLSQITAFGIAAVNFLSAFSHESTWEISVLGTESHHRLSPETIFLRFRLPFLDFEWRIRTPEFALNAVLEQGRRRFLLETSWHAYAYSPVAPSLVASGVVVDSIVLEEGTYPLIEHRHFVVHNIRQPELMRPRPLLRAAPANPVQRRRNPQNFSSIPPPERGHATQRPLVQIMPNEEPDDGGDGGGPGDPTPPDPGDPEGAIPPDTPTFKLSFYENLLRWLRSAQGVITFIISVATVLASSQPLVDAIQHRAGVALAVVGIIGATGSALLVVIRKVLQDYELTLVKTEWSEDINAKRSADEMNQKR